jgi:hypothetical protein
MNYFNDELKAKENVILNPLELEGNRLLKSIYRWYMKTTPYQNEQWRINILDKLNALSVD